MRLQEGIEENSIKRLIFLKKILGMINNGAIGFDLAYEVEKFPEFKHLIYDGILFYNTFIEIGNNRFIDVPDKVKTNYISFVTIEDTEKFIFMVWLKDAIQTLEKQFHSNESYIEYLKKKQDEEQKLTEKILRKKLTRCLKCGNLIKSEEQIYCEVCGANILEQLH